jgi:hypothetical protein
VGLVGAGRGARRGKNGRSSFERGQAAFGFRSAAVGAT